MLSEARKIGEKNTTGYKDLAVRDRFQLPKTEYFINYYHKKSAYRSEYRLRTLYAKHQGQEFSDLTSN